MITILYDIGYSIHSAFLENTVIHVISVNVKKVDSCCRSGGNQFQLLVHYQLPSLAANQNPRSKRLKMKLALGVQILNQDGHLSRTELFDKIYVFSLNTSQHEDALSHEYTKRFWVEHRISTAIFYKTHLKKLIFATFCIIVY